MVNKKSTGLYDDKVRINVFLPANDAKERMAIDRSLDLVRGMYNGVTQSLIRPVSFEGWWWDAKRNKFVRDKIVVLLVDAPYEISDGNLDQDVEQIKLEILNFYKQAGKKQKVLWLTVHQTWMAV